MKNFHKVRGKREFLFDDRELIGLGVATLIICVLIFVLGFQIGRDSQKETVASPLENEAFMSQEEVASLESEESDTSSDTLVAKSSSPEVPANEKPYQQSYSSDITPPEEEVVVDVPDPTASKPPSEEQPSEEAVSESPQQEDKEESLTQPVVTATIPAPQASQNVAVAPGALPPVPKNPTDPMPVGRQVYESEEGTVLSGTVYSVQVSSSPDRLDSERLQQKFMEFGYEAYVRPADLGEKGLWFRVIVGNVATQEEAEQLKQEILSRAPHLARGNNPFVTKISE
jgi:DedD protein